MKFENTRIKGKRSEEFAEEFLLTKGFKLISKNSYFKGGEIDLIMQDDEFIVFIEVKSVNEDSAISIYETLSQRKISRLRRSINKWLAQNNKQGEIWRFDFVGVVVDNKNNLKSIEHFPFVSLNT